MSPAAAPIKGGSKFCCFSKCCSQQPLPRSIPPCNPFASQACCPVFCAQVAVQSRSKAPTPACQHTAAACVEQTAQSCSKLVSAAQQPASSPACHSSKSENRSQVLQFTSAHSPAYTTALGGIQTVISTRGKGTAGARCRQPRAIGQTAAHKSLPH